MWPFGGRAQSNTGVDCGSPLKVALRNCQHGCISRPFSLDSAQIVAIVVLSFTIFAKPQLASCTAGLRLLLQSMCATATISSSLCFWGTQGQRLCSHSDCHPKSHGDCHLASLLLHHQEAQNQLQHTQRHLLL